MAEARTDYDIIFRDSNNAYYYARIHRGVEGGYRSRYVRAEIQQQLLVQSEVPALKSRADSQAMYQSSWAAGSRWWKPLIAGSEVESYFQSNHMDTWSEPGKVVPMNALADAANTNLHDNCVMAVGAAGAVYAVGFTESTDTGFFDVYVWTPASDAFVRDAAQNSGVDDDDVPFAMTYDQTDGYFYIITSDDIVRFTPTGDDEDAAWLDITGGTIGANIFTTPYGLMFYDGTSVYTIAKAGPTATEVFDDGMGADFLSGVTFAGSAPLFRQNLRLAISTSSGIYYVKNTWQQGQPQPFLFRVDRDAAGNFIGNPIATLPMGTVALSIIDHLGSIIISASPDWRVIVANDTNEAEITLYHVTQGQMGALGSLLGGRSALDETPYALLGSQGSLLYIGGQKRLWIWDAARGGLHTAWSWTTELANGAYVAMANVLDSAGAGAQIFLGADRIARIKEERVANPDTVSAFGDDETHYTLESNYFDAGLPMESKRLDRVEILFDPSTGTSGSPNQEWTVQVSVDDGAFSDVITAASSGVDYTDGFAAAWAAKQGRLFRYKLIYQTKTAVKNALKAIMVTFNSGEMVREWEFIFDGTEFTNINNEVIDPAEWLTSMRDLAELTQVAMYDNFNSDRNADITSGSSDQITVKIVEVEMLKDSPDETLVRMVVRETPFASSLT